jgi:hypothetical protein
MRRCRKIKFDRRSFVGLPIAVCRPAGCGSRAGIGNVLVGCRTAPILFGRRRRAGKNTDPFSLRLPCPVAWQAGGSAVPLFGNDSDRTVARPGSPYKSGRAPQRLSHQEQQHRMDDQ